MAEGGKIQRLTFLLSTKGFSLSLLRVASELHEVMAWLLARLGRESHAASEGRRREGGGPKGNRKERSKRRKRTDETRLRKPLEGDHELILDLALLVALLENDQEAGRKGAGGSLRAEMSGRTRARERQRGGRHRSPPPSPDDYDA